MNEVKLIEADLKDFFFTLSDVYKEEFDQVNEQVSYILTDKLIHE